jgi:hypothetical protein
VSGVAAMRVIYARILISGVLLAAMLAFGAFGPQRDAPATAPPLLPASAGQ